MVGICYRVMVMNLMDKILGGKPQKEGSAIDDFGCGDAGA